MAELIRPQFISCTPKRFKNGIVKQIQEIVSPEVPFDFSYACNFTQSEGSQSTQVHSFSGESRLYAYPVDVEKLVLGHTVLDILPCYDADFSMKVNRVDERYHVELQATPSQRLPVSVQKISFAKALATMEKVLDAPGMWDGTGCFHRAALFHPVSEALILAEDIGRHNCVDRLKGHALLHNLPIEKYFLFITARITASLYDKIHRAGIRNMVSRSAITSSSYIKAQEECTLAAFCRPEDGRLTLFCGDAIF